MHQNICMYIIIVLFNKFIGGYFIWDKLIKFISFSQSLLLQKSRAKAHSFRGGMKRVAVHAWNWYNSGMGQEYRHMKTTVSLINYHFVFCPRYRRKVLVGQVESRFKELVAEICAQNDWMILAMEVMPDHVHLFLNCLPTDSPSGIMETIKVL